MTQAALPKTVSPQVDIVIPVFNEEVAVLAFHQLLCQVIDAQPTYQFHIFYVNDGSTDTTQSVLESLAGADRRITVLELSRNFGHQAALTAGLDQAQADFVITMDGDGQHPPTLIPEMLRLAESGYEVVLAQRAPEQTSSFKSWTSGVFYRLINRIGDTSIQPGAADFRLLAQTVVESLRSMREYHRLLRGMVAWMGFRSIILPYVQPERLAGYSKYSLRKMFRLAMHAIFSFSLVPLTVGVMVGGIFLLLALFEMGYVLSFWITGNQSGLVPGWSSLMFVLLVVGGSLMITLGIIGIYIGYIFQEVKGRPIYLVRRRMAAQQDPAGEDAPHA